jgi:protein involved in polysaccharide export with SLBB domain
MCAVLISWVPATVSAQTRDSLKQQAEGQLKQMTPEQIDAKIKELGMTRKEAEAKAEELGIDLSTFLQLRPGAKPAQAKPEALPEEAQVPVEERPKPRRDTLVTLPPRGVDSLAYFGYEIFSGVPAAFEPTAAGPADPDYVIGSDDVLRVTVWGQAEFQNELTVDKEGRIIIPTLGPVLVSGLTLQKAYEKLKKEMSRSYAGLVGRQPTVWLDVTLARLRPKRVYMMGELRKPGGYTVSSYANVFNSLYSVGGPTVQGSLRDVRVIRGDRVIAHVDLYKYLTGAEQTDDIRIQNNDIVFVPPRGKTVSIRKEVRHPAIFELLPGENLRKLLDYAGGALSSAYLERVQIDRIVPFIGRTQGGPERLVIDVDFRAILNQNKDYELQDSDRVSIFPILDPGKNIVTIIGSVFRPGRYQLEKAGSVRSLILAAEGLQPDAYAPIAHIFRLNNDWVTRRIIPFDLQRVMNDPVGDIPLVSRDSVIIYSTRIVEVKDKYVTIFGEVKSVGRYPLRANMTLSDVIAMAGGYTEAADRSEAEISRVSERGFGGDTLAVLLRTKLPQDLSARPVGPVVDSVSVQDLISRGEFVLQHRDEILVLPNPNYKFQQNVSIEGDIKYPGVYTIQKRGERLSELLARAGGPTTTSYFGGAQLIRKGQRLLVDVEEVYRNRTPEQDVVLLPDDRLIIPPRPHTVLVTGEVNRPGLLSFIKGDGVSGYIDRAGGLTDSSWYAILTQPTGESRRVNFGFLRANPEVYEGSTVYVKKVPPPEPEKGGEPTATTIKDLFAIAMSAATVVTLIWQVSK